MERSTFDILENLAARSFEDCQAGLLTLLRNNDSFPKFMERKYRLKAFNETHDFYMTSNERYFHLIGFIDAVIWLERSGYICSDHQDDKEECIPDDEYEASLIAQEDNDDKAIWALITSFEAGDGY